MSKTNNLNIGALSRQLLTIYRTAGVLSLFFYLSKVINDTYIKKYIWGSFSQKGEDLIIEEILGKKKRGFYIDIGAHNPTIFNNTKRFYEKGWHGINIEPNPKLIREFLNQRVKDINLPIGVGKKSGKAIFFEFFADGLSTFSKTEADKNIQLGYKIKQKVVLPVYTLSEIMRKYVKSHVDFISIDTEGLDLPVLESNNWKKYRPSVICIETGDFSSMIKGSVKNSKKNKIDTFLKGNGYREYYTNGLNTIYVDKNVKTE